MDAESLRSALAGAKLSLLDEHAIQNFSFSEEGNGVAATLGTRGGPVCAPGLWYRVLDDGAVELTGGEALSYRWEQVELQDGILTVRCDRRVNRFQFTPGQKRERYLP